MRSNFLICILVFFAINVNFLFTQDISMNLSGVLDSTVNYAIGAGDAPRHSFGFEEYANLRLRIRAGEKVIFNTAFNLTVLSGNFLENAAVTGSYNPYPAFASTPLVYGENYAAALELERLYFRINGDYIDTEAGLLRIPFGYGQVWGSSDFLNPRNPLFPNARLRGVLGANFSFYPTDALKLMVFAAAPKNPMETKGGGFIPGLSLDHHWNRASLQVLYAYESPKRFDETPGDVSQDSKGSSLGIHRFGLSLKADLVLGFAIDALYTLNPDDAAGIDGLSVGAGFDYNFFDGDLYILMEYLFNGASSSTAFGFGGSWINNHYLYGTALYRFDDYFNLSLSTVFCFDDLSFSPFVTLNYELFQGFSLSLTARLPMDQKTMNGGKVGELGPLPPGFNGNEVTRGSRFIINAGAKLRF